MADVPGTHEEAQRREMLVQGGDRALRRQGLVERDDGGPRPRSMPAAFSTSTRLASP